MFFRWCIAKPVLRNGFAAGAVAGAVSGAPSTLAALVAGRDPLEASLAAGALLLPHETRTGRLLAAAVPVHLGISLGWGAVLSVLLPQRRTAAWGAAAGLAIAALDLGVVGRRHAPIRALPAAPQVADHIAWGLVASLVLARRRARGSSTGPVPEGLTPNDGSGPRPGERRRPGSRRSRQRLAAPRS